MARLELPAGANVLLRFPNWLGDVILCTPALAALRRARPDLRLAALVKGAALPAVEGLDGIEIVLNVGETSPSGTFRLARELRARDFDAALVFPKGFREALLVRLAGIPERIGLATDRRSPLLTRPVPFTEADWRMHHAFQFAKVLEPMGIALGDEGLSFPVGENARAEAAELLAGAGLESRPFAAFHLTASKMPRAWHAGRFAEIAVSLEQMTGLRPALLGSEADAAVHAEFLQTCASAADFAGKTTLKGMAAIVERSSIFLGSDSGPMHIAAAVGAKVVAVFGPGAPEKTAPLIPADRLRVLYASLPCSPCRQAFFRDCDPSPAGKPPCVEAISKGAVLAAALELLEPPTAEPGA